MSNIIHVTNTDLPGLALYKRLNENQLMHYNEPFEGVFMAESPKVIQRALNAGYEIISFLFEEHQLVQESLNLIAPYPDAPVYIVPSEIFSPLTGLALSRGALCAMKRRPLPSVEDLCRKANRIAILDKVENPTNIGAIFRSAAALKMDAVLLAPGCSDPLYRRASRVSMGTVFQVPWTYLCNRKSEWPLEGMESLRKLGFKIAAMALTDNSVSIDDPILASEDKLAILMGNEGNGLTDETIAAADYTVKIPMAAGIDSLNVAAASAVAFWELRKK